MKLSRQTKEIIKTVLFFLVLAVLVFAYIIYPLNRIKTLTAREDLDSYNSDSLVTNDPSAYIEAGLPVDTFRFEPDGLTNLACLWIPPPTDTIDSLPTGTAILLHDDNANRDSLVTLAAILHDSGFAVITYDQRASRFTTGKYRGEGQLEAGDVQELISHLEIRQEIFHPLYLVGFGLGADAAILAAHEEQRVDGVVAVRPYLTTPRMQDELKRRFDTYWFPFYRTIMWWWYGIRSGYGAPYRRVEDIRPVASRTLVYVEPDEADDEAVVTLKDLSDDAMLDIVEYPGSAESIYPEILKFISPVAGNR